jgi:hypothetical protein
MIGPDESDRRIPKGEAHTMKKLTTLMLGMTLVFGSAALFAQEKKDDTKKEEKKGKKGGKKKDETKKEEKK